MTPPTPISRDELVRDLTKVHPLPKSKVREMIDAYVAQEVAKEKLVCLANAIHISELESENGHIRDAIDTLLSYARKEES